MNDKGYTKLVLESLRGGPKSTQQIVGETGLTKQQVADTLSQQIKKSRVTATPVIYQLADEQLKNVVASSQKKL